MKNYLILFGLLFSIFLFPKNVFASEIYYLPYNNFVSDFDVLSGEGENLKNQLYNSLSSDLKKDNDKCVLFKANTSFMGNYTSSYILSCSSSFNSYLSYDYLSYNSFFKFPYDYDSSFRFFKFDNSYNFLSSSSSFTSVGDSSFKGFSNIFLYSDFPIKITGISSNYSSISIYNINDSDDILATFSLYKTYDYKDFYLSDSNENVVVFQDNDIHNISKLILGDNIPEEYSFVYTISDYLIVLIVVGVLISPIAIIIKVLRW